MLKALIDSPVLPATSSLKAATTSSDVVSLLKSLEVAIVPAELLNDCMRKSHIFSQVSRIYTL